MMSVFKIPPRSTSGGYKCGEWLQSDNIWFGRIRVVARRNRCEICLEDPNSDDLFAACFIYHDHRDTAVELVLDSSRYFVLKIEDDHGKHAFIGLGFNERRQKVSATSLKASSEGAAPGFLLGWRSKASFLYRL